MNSNLRIDAIKLNDVIEGLESEINNLSSAYKEIENKMSVLDGSNDIWKSNAQKTTYEYYDSIEKEFAKSIENIKTLKDFLKTTLDNYMDSIKTNKKNVENNEDNISIN